MSTTYADRPTVRIPMGWRTFYVYDAAGVMLGSIGAFHEEAARREVAMIHGLNHEDLASEMHKRPGNGA